jgi:hypothetical protein
VLFPICQKSQRLHSAEGKSSSLGKFLSQSNPVQFNQIQLSSLQLISLKFILILHNHFLVCFTCDHRRRVSRQKFCMHLYFSFEVLLFSSWQRNCYHCQNIIRRIHLVITDVHCCEISCNSKELRSSQIHRANQVICSPVIVSTFQSRIYKFC